MSSKTQKQRYKSFVDCARLEKGGMLSPRDVFSRLFGSTIRTNTAKNPLHG